MVGAALSGGGHSLAAMKLLFPYGVTVGILEEDGGWALVGMLLLFLQFPFYCFLFVNTAGNTRRYLTATVVVVHALCAFLSFGIGR